VILAERFTPEVEQTLRYLRVKQGMDITGVQVTVHKTGAEVLIQTEVIVGRELPTKPSQSQPHAATPHETPEETRARVTSQFLKENVGLIEERLANIGNGALEVRPRSGGSDNSLYIGGVQVGLYYYAKQFLTFRLWRLSPADVEELRSHFPDLQRKDWGQPNFYVNGVQLHVTDEAGLTTVEQVLRRKTESTGHPATSSNAL
jgi:hypothetical protein